MVDGNARASGIRGPFFWAGMPALLGALGLTCSQPVDDVFYRTEKGEAAVPVAYLFDPASSDFAAEALAEAGFEVRQLPLFRSPQTLQGLVVLGSGAAEDPAYRAYMEQYAEDFHPFVDRANVLLQLEQKLASEPQPPFLPTTHSARRGEGMVEAVRVVTPSNAAMAGIALDTIERNAEEAGLARGTFVEQGGFEVVLAGKVGDEWQPILMEGAYGQGRILLSTVAIDRAREVEWSAERSEFARRFFANLYTHVMAVRARKTAALMITGPAGVSSFAAGSWKLAVLPDTQVYALRYPGLFSAQTAWIASQAEVLDIRYVIHLGDIVNNNTAREWAHARAAMGLLDGVVPYALVPGNHDYGPSGDASTRDTLLNQYFSYGDSAAWPTFGGAYEEGRLDNSYHLFSAAGRDFIIVALEWGPRDEVIEWANQIMAEHAHRDGIFVTHAYLNHNDRRYDHTATQYDQSFNPHEYRTPGGVNDGEELWQKLIRHHRFVMTLNGHVLADGVGYLISTTDRGNPCHQMLSNYQFRAQGGEGYMRILEFLPDGQTVQVFTYSPLYDDFLREPEQAFRFTLPPM